MREILSLLAMFLVGFVSAQNSEVSYISFDGCDGAATGVFSDASIVGGSGCECGVVGNSLALSGNSSAVVFDTSYTAIFQNDFTLSFYFMLNESSTGTVDVLSIANQCGVDSSLTIKYVPAMELIRVEMAKDFDLNVTLQAEVNLDQCWHQLVFQREDKNYNLFIDGEFKESGFVNGNIVLSPSASMKFSQGPCQSIGEQPFTGRIDEFWLFSSALGVSEVFSLFEPLDQILTPDTTIFSNTSVTIDHTFSCADNVVWAPNSNVADRDELQPTISPVQSEKYFIVYDYGICQGLDSVSISIIDEDKVQCDDLLLSNAFTPNGDGLNDEFGISNAFIIEEFRSFEIFDRWGEKVFSAASGSEKWDGNLKNQKINSNVFLYKVNYTCKGEAFVQTGSFSILR